MRGSFAGLGRWLTLALLALLAAGCASSGRGGNGGASAGARGAIVLTTQGARTTLRGDPASVAGSVDEVFRVLDITLTREDVDADGGRVEGRAGSERILIDMTAVDGDQTRVEVRVQQNVGERWDRAAARGILDELRRWQAS